MSIVHGLATYSLLHTSKYNPINDNQKGIPTRSCHEPGRDVMTGAYFRALCASISD